MATDRKRQNKAEIDECELLNKEQTIHSILRKRFGITGTMLTDFVYALCPCLENKNDDDAVVDTANRNRQFSQWKVNRNRFWSA